MANTKEFFLSVTQRVFSNWTALQMAVQHGMGTKERARDFCAYVTEVIFMNENLDSAEVANELEDYMDDQFNTQLEDNSATQVAGELLRFFQYCVANNENLAVAEFEKLPALQTWIVCNEPTRTNRNSYIPEDDSSSESEEEVTGNMEVADDEWTEVRTRRKR